jgi:hypothetical protein
LRVVGMSQRPRPEVRLVDAYNIRSLPFRTPEPAEKSLHFAALLMFSRDWQRIDHSVDCGCRP